MDDDTPTCPLCCETMDSTDLNFLPCPCGYQVCLFCYQSLKEGESSPKCPGCRKPYSDGEVVRDALTRDE